MLPSSSSRLNLSRIYIASANFSLWRFLFREACSDCWNAPWLLSADCCWNGGACSGTVVTCSTASPLRPNMVLRVFDWTWYSFGGLPEPALAPPALWWLLELVEPFLRGIVFSFTRSIKEGMSSYYACCLCVTVYSSSTSSTLLILYPSTT